MCSVCLRQVPLSTLHSFTAIVTTKGDHLDSDVHATVCWSPCLEGLAGDVRSPEDHSCWQNLRGSPEDGSSPISKVSTPAQKAGTGTGALPSSHEPPTSQRHGIVMAFLPALIPQRCLPTLAYQRVRRNIAGILSWSTWVSKDCFDCTFLSVPLKKSHTGAPVWLS